MLCRSLPTQSDPHFPDIKLLYFKMLKNHYGGIQGSEEGVEKQ